ncbi:MAG: ArnT family glycosyltransferase [Desulfococcaceae bacterium]
MKNISTHNKLIFPLFALLLLSAFMGTAPFRDIYGLEIRNALFAREMLEDGISLIPHVLGKPYPDYPPLYFWLEVLFSLPSGNVSTLSAVAPSAFSALGLVFFAFLFGREISPRMGWLSALILATFPEFWINAGTACIDMLLAFHVCSALACLYFREKCEPAGKKFLWTAAVPVFIFLAFFTKGPIGLVIPAAARGGFLLLEKRVKSFFLFSLFMAGMTFLCVGCEAWIVWKSGGTDLLREVIRMQVIGRLGQKSSQPFWYYIFCILGSAGIWFLFCSPLWRHSAALLREKGMGKMLPGHPLLRLSLIWFLSTFAIFTLASTRHSRYLLPLYPALAILLAYAAEQILHRDNPLFPQIWERGLSVLTVIVLVSGIAGAAFYTDHIFVPVILIFIWMIAVSAGWIAVISLKQRGNRIAGMILLLLFTGLFGANLLIFPEISRNASGREFTETVESKSDLRLPLVLYNIGSDADGLKFACYSQRRPSELRFITDAVELENMAMPYLLIVSRRDKADLMNIFRNGSIEAVSHGTIRSHHFSAYIIRKGEK